MLKKYLEFRFRTNNRNAYHHYFNEWVNNITAEQAQYFEREMYNLINKGLYDPEKFS